MIYALINNPLTGDPSVALFSRTTIEGAVSYVPVDWGNTDYQAYLSWVNAGNTALSGIPILSAPPPIIAQK